MFILKKKTVFFLPVLMVLLTLLTYCRTRDNLEKSTFDNLAESLRAAKPAANDDSIIVDALHLTHRLLEGKASAFLADNSYDGSLTADLLTAKGCCGSYADVLGELLQRLGYRIRIAQMKVNDVYGGHILTEVLTQKGWVILDAMYDQFFVTREGRLASFRQVSGDWNFYRLQTRLGYNSDYRYSGVRYTNWDRVPVLLPALRRILALSFGERRTQAICMRPFFLRRYHIYSIGLSMLLAILIYSLTVKQVVSWFSLTRRQSSLQLA